MKKILALAATLSLVSSMAFAGKIVVNHDEWTLSNTGFSQSSGAATFTNNLADFFTGGSAGNFHAYSNNFGLTGASLNNTFSNAGHSYSTGTGISFDLTTLQNYDGIFLAGYVGSIDTSILVNYVNSGGNVYLAGGTGNLGAAGEANYWNSFLNEFGLSFTSPYNGVSGNLSVSPSPHVIFDGVGSLYQNNGNTVIDAIPSSANAEIYFGGLYAVYDNAQVPEPSILALMGFGLAGLAFTRRRKTQA